MGPPSAEIGQNSRNDVAKDVADPPKQFSTTQPSVEKALKKIKKHKTKKQSLVSIGVTIGSFLYACVIAHVTMTGIQQVEDTPSNQAKTRRCLWRIALAIAYCSFATTFMTSTTLRERIDRFTLTWVRHGKGRLVLNGCIIVYNCVQVILCLQSAFQCLVAYWNFRGDGLYGWLGFEMTNWEWTLPFLTLYSDLKVLDLLDTVWIISRGSWSHLSLLHVVHHTTMIVPYELWRAFYDTSAPILYTTIPLMNSVVHALLYTYYTVILGRNSKLTILQELAQLFHRNRGLLTCIQYVQFPVAIVVSVLAGIHPNGFLPASFCYGLIGALNAILFAPLLPFFKRRKNEKDETASKSTVTTPQENGNVVPIGGGGKETQTLWFVLEGRAYDVTEYAKVHPGGARILEKLKGRDVTHHFRAFHPRPHLVRKRLASLPTYNPENNKNSNGDVFDGKGKGFDAKASAALERLEVKMEERGDFRPASTLEAWRRILEVLALFGLSARICQSKDTWVDQYPWTEILMVILGASIWGFTVGRCGWIQHDAGHNAFFASPKANKVAQAIFLTVGMSGASFEWNRRHNEHHAVTHEHNTDPDINTTPLLMFYDEAKEYRPPSRQVSVPKWVLMYQAELFSPVLCPAVALAWALYAHPLSCFRRRRYASLFALVMSHILRAYLGLYLTSSYMYAAVFWTVNWTVGPAYIFTLFAMSHTVTPVRHDDGELHWARAAFRTTVDASPRSIWASWFTGNLNCQVAHHLFPRLPTSRLSGLTDDIAQLAKELDETYQCTTLGQALLDMYTNLKAVGLRAVGEKCVKQM